MDRPENFNLHDSGLSMRALGCLDVKGVKTLHDLMDYAMYHRFELKRTRNLGPTTYNEIMAFLRTHGADVNLVKIPEQSCRKNCVSFDKCADLRDAVSYYKSLCAVVGRILSRETAGQRMAESPARAKPADINLADYPKCADKLVCELNDYKAVLQNIQTAVAER